MPVAVVALVWVLFALFVLASPDNARVPALVVLGLLAVGGAYFGVRMATDRSVFDHEPDAGDAVVAIEPEAAPHTVPKGTP